MNRALVYELATARFIGQRKDNLTDLATVQSLSSMTSACASSPTTVDDLLELITRNSDRGLDAPDVEPTVDDGENYSVIPPPSPPCSIGCSITPMCSSTVRSWRTKLQADFRADHRTKYTQKSRGPETLPRMTSSTHCRFSAVHRGCERGQPHLANLECGEARLRSRIACGKMAKPNAETI